MNEQEQNEILVEIRELDAKIKQLESLRQSLVDRLDRLYYVSNLRLDGALMEVRAPDATDYGDKRLEPPVTNEEETTPPTVAVEVIEDRCECGGKVIKECECGNHCEECCDCREDTTEFDADTEEVVCEAVKQAEDYVNSLMSERE